MSTGEIEVVASKAEAYVGEKATLSLKLLDSGCISLGAMAGGGLRLFTNSFDGQIGEPHFDGQVASNCANLSLVLAERHNLFFHRVIGLSDCAARVAGRIADKSNRELISLEERFASLRGETVLLVSGVLNQGDEEKSFIKALRGKGSRLQVTDIVSVLDLEKGGGLRLERDCYVRVHYLLRASRVLETLSKVRK